METAISAIASDATKLRETKIYKRVSYAAARRQFAKLSKEDLNNSSSSSALAFRKEQVWNTSPIPANFRVVPIVRHWNPSSEFLRLVPTNFEIDGEDVGVKQGEKNNFAQTYKVREVHEAREIRERNSRNHLRYILRNSFHTNLHDVKISSSPRNWNYDRNFGSRPPAVRFSLRPFASL